MNTLALGLLALTASFSLSASEHLAPIFPGAKIVDDITMSSSKPGVKIRQVAAKSTEKPEEVYQYYKNLPHTENCRKRKDNGTYDCDFVKKGKISSGSMWVDINQYQGKTSFTLDYFYKK